MNYPVIHQRHLPALNGGLNGWFGKFIRSTINSVVKAVKSIPIIGGTIATVAVAIVETISGNDQLFTGDNDYTGNHADGSSNAYYTNKFVATVKDDAANYEPTVAEQGVIKTWSDGKLTTFYKALVTQLSTAFANSDFDFQLKEINAVMAKMCVVRQHFMTLEKTGLSEDGVKARLALIDGIFAPVYDLIAKSVAKYPQIINKQNYTLTQANAVALQPLITTPAIGTAYSCSQYIGTEKTNPNASGSATVLLPGVANNNNTPADKNTGKIIFLVVAAVAAYLLTKKK